MEAAVAYYEATGKDKLLKCMEKYADCIESAFIKDKTAKFITPGHEEIELALVKMYRCTKNEKYLKMAQYFIDNRGYALILSCVLAIYISLDDTILHSVCG